MELATKFESFEAEKPTQVLNLASPNLLLVSSKKHDFSHSLCEEIIGFQEFEGERSLRPPHVNYLINAMLRNTFHQEWVNLVVCKYNDVQWRMNGQHTCLARLELPKAWKQQNQVTVLTYAASTYDAMRELYASIDRNSPRTKGNIIHSYLGGHAMFVDAPPTLVRLLGESLSFWLWEGGHERAKHDGDEISYLMLNEHMTLVQTVLNFCLLEPKILSCEHMRRTPVIAALYETFNHVFQASSTFWTSVKTGVGFDTTNDPGLRLRNALINTKLSNSDTVRRSKCIDRETQYRWCINAFNHWRKGDDMKVLNSTQQRQRAR